MSSIRVAVLLLALPLLLSSQPPSLPEGDLAGLSCSTGHQVNMTVFGHSLSYDVTDSLLETTPTWNAVSGTEPPLRMSEAVKLSRAELAQYFPAVPEWVCETITLERLGWGDHWFYVVEWKAKRNHEGDYLGIPVLMTGEPVRLTKD